MKRIKRILCSFLAVMLLTGCGAKALSEESVMDNASTMMPQSESMDWKEEPTGESVGSESADMFSAAPRESTQKLIRKFEISIQTKEFDLVLASVQNKVSELGGYVESSSLAGGSAYEEYDNRYASMSVRIPADQLDGFVENVRETANVTDIYESSEDVTLQYVDVESRTKALETEQQRLLELMEKAETVEDIIAIESRLSEVRYQLESYMSQLRTLDNKIDYSMVQLEIQEVERETKPVSKGFWEQVSERFGNNLYRMGRDVKELAIAVLGSLPYLLVWAALIGAAVFVIRIVVKKKRLQRMARNLRPEEENGPQQKEEGQ